MINQYKIQEKTEEGRIITIKADKIDLRIPKEADSLEELEFAVLSIKEKKKFESYELGLTAQSDLKLLGYDTISEDCYIDDGGDIETNLTISRELLKEWTGLTGKEIDKAFTSIHVGSTYNLMLKMPRRITVKKDWIIIEKSSKESIDSLNVSNLIFDGRYPLDE